MKNTLSPHFHKSVFSAFLGALIAFILNLVFCAINQALTLNWLFILVVALFSALCSYLTSLRKQVDELGEKFTRLKYKVDTLEEKLQGLNHKIHRE